MFFLCFMIIILSSDMTVGVKVRHGKGFSRVIHLKGESSIKAGDESTWKTMIASL